MSRQDCGDQFCERYVVTVRYEDTTMVGTNTPTLCHRCLKDLMDRTCAAPEVSG